MTDRRPLVLLGVFVVALGGFIGIRAADGSPKSSTSDTPTTTATTPPTPTSGLKTEWQPALSQINAAENALFRDPDPDPAKVDVIMDPACTCNAQTKSRLATLKQNGWHVAGDNLVITSSNVTKVDGPDQVEVFVNLSIPGYPVVDANGNTVQAGAAPQNGALLYILRRTTDNSWRLLDRHSVNG